MADEVWWLVGALLCAAIVAGCWHEARAGGPLVCSLDSYWVDIHAS